LKLLPILLLATVANANAIGIFDPQATPCYVDYGVRQCPSSYTLYTPTAAVDPSQPLYLEFDVVKHERTFDNNWGPKSFGLGGIGFLLTNDDVSTPLGRAHADGDWGYVPNPDQYGHVGDHVKLDLSVLMDRPSWAMSSTLFLFSYVGQSVDAPMFSDEIQIPDWRFGVRAQFTAWDLTQPAIAAPIPEPETWALMLLGFAAGGWRFRKNRGQA